MNIETLFFHTRYPNYDIYFSWTLVQYILKLWFHQTFFYRFQMMWKLNTLSLFALGILLNFEKLIFLIDPFHNFVGFGGPPIWISEMKIWQDSTMFPLCVADENVMHVWNRNAIFEKYENWSINSLINSTVSGSEK